MVMKESSRLAEKEEWLIAILVLCTIQENGYFDYFMFTTNDLNKFK